MVTMMVRGNMRKVTRKSSSSRSSRRSRRNIKEREVGRM